MSENSAKQSPDALFFGLLEGLSFLCLFLSPLVSAVASAKIWFAVAALRVLVLAVRVLPSRTSSAPPDRKALAEFWKQGWLYQLPFWGASLLFPLSEGQAKAAFSALALQLVLTGLLWLIARRNSRLSGESAVYLSYLASSYLWSPSGWWMGVAAVGFVFTLRGSRREVRRPLTSLQCLAIGTMWLVGGVLPTVSAHPVVHPQLLLGWQFLAIFTILLLEQQKRSHANAEGENSTPMRVKANVWFLNRQVARRSLGWAAATCLVVQAPERDAALLALLFLACGKAVFLAARQWLEANRALWWIASELTLVWALVNWSDYQSQITLIALSGLSLAVVANWPLAQNCQVAVLGSEGRASLEMQLRESLRESAPKTLIGRVLEEFEGSEIEEDDLSATAPSGFRQRLLDRLRNSSEESD